MQPKTSSPSWWQLIITPLALVATTVAVYYSSLHYSFQFDDVASIKKLFTIRHSTFTKLFFSGSRWISYWMNAVYYSIDKFNPYIYRVGNVTFHCIGGILVFYLIYTLLSTLKTQNFYTRNKLLLATATAGFFLLHPVQTQTISYVIQGQLEGLASILSIAVVLCFVKFSTARSTVSKYIYGALMFSVAALSTGTKEIAIVSPILVMLTDWFFVSQGDWQLFKKNWKIHAGLFATVWGLYIYFLKPAFFGKLFSLKLQTRNNIGNQLTQDPTQKIYPIHFAISQFKVMLHYFGIFLWPFNISVEYDWVLSTSFFTPDCFFPFMAIATLWGYLIRLWRKNSTNLIVFAFAWFFISIAPRCSIIPSSELMTDYKTYLGSVGVLFLLSSGLIWLIIKGVSSVKKSVPAMNKPYGASGAVAMLLLLSGWATHERNKVWRSPLEFWGNVIENAPGKARAYNNFAVALSDQKRYREAVPFYKKATQMDGRYPDPWNNLAVSYSLLGDIDGAIIAMKKSVEIQPYYPEAYNNLASFFLQKNEYAKAEKMLKLALKLRKHYGKAYFNYGKLYLQQEKLELALPYFKKACMEADLDNELGFKVYSQVSLKLQKWDEAIIGLTKCLELSPSSEKYKGQLAQAYLASGKNNKSLILFEQLIMRNGFNPKYQFNAGEAAYQLGQYQKSLKFLTKAQQLGLKTPNLFIRFATCHDKLNNKGKAREALTIAQNLPNVSPGLKKQISTQLAQLQLTT